MTKHPEDEPQKTSAAPNGLENYLKQIIISVIAGLIATWILSLITNWTLLYKLFVVFQVGFIFLIPLLLQKGLAKLNLPVGRIGLIILSILFMMGAAALFSSLPGGAVPPLKSAEKQVRGIFSDEYVYLRGSSDCRQRETPCLNRVRVDQDNVQIGRNYDGTLSLDILLDVEWDRWERFPSLPRNYKGQVYYQVQHQCNGSAKPQVEGEPTLIGSQLRPGRILLSWMIGFVETPFMLDTERDVPKKIREAIQNNSTICG